MHLDFRRVPASDPGGAQIVSGTHEGTVESIELRATMLRTYDDRRVIIPNSDLYTNRVTVNPAYDQILLHQTEPTEDRANHR